MKLNRTTSALVAGSAALALVLAGCGSDGNGDATTTDATATTTATDGTEAASESSVTFTEAYIKEKPADKNMTAIFGVLTNNTDEDINIKSFKVEGLAEGTVYEQHDTADGKMFEVPEGLTIPANGKLELVPGGKHLMIMENDEDLAVGQMHTVVIELSDGSTITQEIDVRVQPAGEEDYAPGGEGLSAPGNARPDAGVEGEGEMDMEGESGN